MRVKNMSKPFDVEINNSIAHIRFNRPEKRNSMNEDFWNLFASKKILIHQEDSIIFKNNINDFLKYDYIGAPWPNSRRWNKRWNVYTS